MKKSIMQKALILAVICGLTLTTVNCGIILHPERKGNKSGTVDVPVVVMDCLWFFVAIVPGVVALVVDYATGGIYESGTAMNAVPGEKFTFRLRGSAPQAAEVAVKLQASNGKAILLLDRKVAKGEEIGKMKFVIPEELSAGKYSLSLTINEAPQAEWSLNVASAQ